MSLYSRFSTRSDARPESGDRSEMALSFRYRRSRPVSCLRSPRFESPIPLRSSRVSFLLFAVLNYATTKVGGMVSHDVVPNTTEELLRMLGAQAAVDLAFAVVFAGATAWLLDRKVSL